MAGRSRIDRAENKGQQQSAVLCTGEESLRSLRILRAGRAQIRCCHSSELAFVVAGAAAVVVVVVGKIWTVNLRRPASSLDSNNNNNPARRSDNIENRTDRSP